MYSRVFNMLGK